MFIEYDLFRQRTEALLARMTASARAAGRDPAGIRLLPVTKITVETASFDMQLLKNPDISGKEYQEGEQLGFWNIREYVLCRDGHVCQHCYGRSKDPVIVIAIPQRLLFVIPLD